MDDLQTPKPQNPNSQLHIANHSRSFKKHLRKQRKEQKRQKKLEERLEQDLHFLLLDKPTPKPRSLLPEADIPWTILSEPDPKPESTGWGAAWEPMQKHEAASRLNKDELSRVEMQGKCLMKCKEFFLTDEFGDEEEEELYERSLYFFRGLFENVENLRGYYERNLEKGVFVCFVCEGIGEKIGKRYVDCAALVQHANSVKKTKSVCAHRAFGRIVCDVLSWDVHKFSEKEDINEEELQQGVKEDLMDYMYAKDG